MGENERIIKTSKTNLALAIELIEYVDSKDDRNNIIEKGIQYLIDTFKDKELKKFQENQFRISIHKHFSWIKEHRKNKYSPKSKLKDYKQGDIDNIDTYYKFYTYLIQNIKSIETDEDINNQLIKYFISIQNKYCY